MFTYQGLPSFIYYFLQLYDKEQRDFLLKRAGVVNLKIEQDRTTLLAVLKGSGCHCKLGGCKAGKCPCAIDEVECVVR